MYEELKEVQAERTYWVERLTRTSMELEKKYLRKRKACNPIKQMKFKLLNTKHSGVQSVLLTSGSLSLTPDSLMMTNRGRCHHRVSDFVGSSWKRSATYSPSYFKRKMSLVSKSIRPSNKRTSKFAATSYGNLFALFSQFL